MAPVSVHLVTKTVERGVHPLAQGAGERAAGASAAVLRPRVNGG